MEYASLQKNKNESVGYRIDMHHQHMTFSLNGGLRPVYMYLCIFFIDLIIFMKKVVRYILSPQYMLYEKKILEYVKFETILWWIEEGTNISSIFYRPIRI